MSFSGAVALEVVPLRQVPFVPPSLGKFPLVFSNFYFVSELFSVIFNSDLGLPFFKSTPTDECGEDPKEKEVFPKGSPSCKKGQSCGNFVCR